MSMYDEESVSASVFSVSALPKCCCSWKNCRSYQKTFRDKNHETLNGAIKFKFAQDNEQDLALKEAFDRILQIEADRRAKWKDGAIKYWVARHHFTEAMVKKSLKSKSKWKWNEPLSDHDARKYLWELNEADTVNISDTETGYLKVPNVPKDHVKEVLKTLNEEPSIPQGLDIPKPPKSTPRDGKSPKKPSSVKDLEGLLNSLEEKDGHDDDDDGGKKKKKKRDEGSMVSEKSKKEKRKSKSESKSLSPKRKSGSRKSVGSLSASEHKVTTMEQLLDTLPDIEGGPGIPDASNHDESVASSSSKKEKRKSKSKSKSKKENGDAAAATDEIKAQLEKLKEELEQEKTKSEDLSKQLAEKEKSSEDANAKLVDLNVQLKEAKLDAEVRELKLKEKLEEEMAKSSPDPAAEIPSPEIEELKTQLNELKQSAAEAEASLKADLAFEKDKTTGALGKLSAAEKALEHASADSNSEIEELKNKVTELESSKATLETELQEEKAKAETAEKKAIEESAAASASADEEATAKLDQLSMQIEELKASAEESENALKEQLAEATKKHLEDSEKAYAEIETLTIQLGEAKSAGDAVEKLAAAEKALEDASADSKLEIEELKAKMAELESSKATLEAALQEERTKAETAEKNAAGESAAASSSADEEATARIEQLSAQIVELKASAEESENALKEQLAEATKKHSDESERANEEIENLTSQLEEAKSSAESTEATLQAELAAEKERADGVVAKLEAKSKGNDSSGEVKDPELADTMKFIDLEKKLEDAESRNSAQEAELKETKQKLEAATDEGSDLTSKNEELQALVEELTEREAIVKSEKEELASEKQQFDQLMETTQSELAVANEELAKLREAADESRDAANVSDEEVHELRQKLAEVEEKYSADLERLSALNQEYETRIDALETELGEACPPEALIEQKSQNEILQKELHVFKKKVEDMELEVDSTQATHREIPNATSDDSSPELQEAYSENMQQRETIERLENSLDEAKREYEERLSALEATISEKEETNEKASAELKSSKETVDSLRKLIAELQEHHKRDTDELKGKVAALERENAEMLAAQVVNSRSRPMDTQTTSRSLALGDADGDVDGEITMEQAIDRLQKEKSSLELEYEKLSTMNLNQKKTIKELEASRTPDDSPEARAMAEREDELEKGTALLANIFYTRTHMKDLTRRGKRISHITGKKMEDPPEEEANLQYDMLEDLMKKKQTKWWKSLDGIFKYSKYIEPMPQDSIHSTLSN